MITVCFGSHVVSFNTIGEAEDFCDEWELDYDMIEDDRLPMSY